MNIQDISSYMPNAITSTGTSGKSKELQNSLENTDLAKASDEELMSACREFEAYFVEMAFKEMEKTAYVFSDEKKDPNNTLVDFFKETTIQELVAGETERNGLGLAQMMFEQMKRNYNI